MNIRSGLTLLFLAVLALSASAQVNAVSVTDASPPGSPIRISGNVIIAESKGSTAQCAMLHETSCALFSTRKDVGFQNVSGRPILAFVASVEVVTATGRHTAESYEAERIFGPLFAPGMTESWPSDSGTTLAPQRTAPQPAIPTATGRTLYVQFADGTTFGDANAGKSLLIGRQKMLEHMAKLDAIYRTQGETAFMSSVQQPGTGDMAGWADTARHIGPAATIARIRRTLATAEQRLAGMASSSSNHQ